MINKEAYCEFCNKEFCNKYFLRTHKMKKHGIASDESMLSGRKRSSTANSNLPLNESPSRTTPRAPSDLLRLSSSTSPSKSMQLLMNGAGNGTNVAALAELVAQQQQQPQLSPRSSVIVNGEHNVSPAQKQARLDTSNKSLTAPTPTETEEETHVCSQCSKTFPSVFTLLAHTYREHAQQQETPTEPPTHASAFTPQKPLLSLTEQPEPGQKTSRSDALSALLDGIETETCACEICKKEFRSKYYLRVHRLNMHGLISEDMQQPTMHDPLAAAQVLKNGTLPPSVQPFGATGESGSTVAALMNQLAAQQQQQQQQSQQQQQQQQLAQNVVASAAQQVTPGRRSKYVTGKNFCDICNKEVCNKYFLRTHMLKMHGVVIDENKLIIGNIDTADRERMGAVVFRCDICSLEMGTRAELKMHKQQAHGVTPIPATSSSGYSSGSNDDTNAPTMVPAGSQHSPSKHTPNGAGMEVCPVCDSRFQFSTQLWKHMRSQHAGVISEQLMDSFIKSAEEFEQQQHKQQLTPTSAEHSLFASPVAPGESETKVLPEHMAQMQQQQLHQQQQQPLSLQQQHQCTLCDAVFGDLVELNLHVIHTHSFAHDIKPSTSSASDTQSVDLPPAAPEKPKPKPKAYKCAFCPYTARWQSNLYAHEKRHRKHNARLTLPSSSVSYQPSTLDRLSMQMIAKATDKPYVCRVCLRGYRYAHSLERHEQVHRVHSMYTSPVKQTNGWCVQRFGPPCRYMRGQKHEFHARDYASAASGRRYRCAQCEKVFRSAEQCRAHALNVHKRAQLAQYTKLLLSNSSSSQQLNTSPQRAVLDCVQQLVNNVHGNDVQECSATPTDNAKPDASSEVTPVKKSALATGYGQLPPDRPDMSDPCGAQQPHVLQAFRAHVHNTHDVLVQDMMLYLPVRKRTHTELDCSVTLTPLQQHTDRVVHL